MSSRKKVIKNALSSQESTPSSHGQSQMNKKRLVQSDLFAEIQQSACNKLVGSVSYPLNVFERRQDFPGCSEIAVQDEGPFYQYTKPEMKQMLKASLAYVESDSNKKDVPIYDEIYSFAGSIIEQAKKVVDAAKEAGSAYGGPDKKELQAIVDGGIEGLVDNIPDFKLYGWCPYLRAIVKKQPQVKLSSPRIDLRGINVEITATGELWWRYPWWNCKKWCFNWEEVHKCNRIVRITVSPSVKIEGHANVEASGSRVHLRGEFDKLRLEYPILDKIPLEGIANQALRDKLVFVYDAAQLVATVPILRSKFTVESLSLPSNPNGISAGIVLRQL